VTTASTALLEVRQLIKSYPIRHGVLGQLFQRGPGEHVKAIDDISFDLAEGEVLGVVGESGSGKSTTGLAVLRLVKPTSGVVRFLGQMVPSGGRALLQFRRQAQMIFQDPYQSLNPRFTIFQTVAEPLIIHGFSRSGLRQRVLDTLNEVGLRPPQNFLEQYPHELSGGQRQRVAIARAVVLRPQLIVADEPVSMLDVSVRAGILRLLRSLSRTLRLSVLYISHDISTVRYLCDRVAVMYLGKIVEIGATAAVLHQPKHPYTSSLIAAVPRVHAPTARPRVQLPGDIQSSTARPDGCVFHPRCPKVFAPCAAKIPPRVFFGQGHEVACHLYDKPETSDDTRASSMQA